MSDYSARLSEYSDLEILGVLYDQRDEANSTATDDVLAALFPATLNKRTPREKVHHARRSVGIRLAWMRRYGLVTRDVNTGRWLLTNSAELLLNGKLTKTQKSLVEAIREETLPSLVAMVGSRYGNLATPTAHVVRREWKHGTGMR